MLQIHVPSRYKDDITEAILDDICRLALGQPAEYQVVEEQRDGRYVRLSSPAGQLYVCVSDNAIKGRNSFLAQYLGTAYSRYVVDPAEQKRLAVYFLPQAAVAGTVASYHHFINRLASSLDITLLNEEAVLGSRSQPFPDFDHLLQQRTQLRGKNASSSYFLDEGGYAAVYGKVYGANAKEAVLLCHAVAKLAGKLVKFFPVEEHQSTKLSETDLAAFAVAGIENQPNLLQPAATSGIDVAEDKIRQTARFHYNLVQKFGDKHCYLCGCNIEAAIIGAHIHRVTDIKKSGLSLEAKIEQAVDGDNGFWFCATHDKLFEVGIIYFQGDKLAITPRLVDEERHYIDSITDNRQIRPEHLNENTKHYIAKHLERIGT